MNDFLQRLQQRKLVQWALAYVAFAFALLQGVDIVAQQFGWPDGMRRGVTLVLAIGFFVALVLAWYHGERGAQRISGTELLILALLLAIGGGLLWRMSLPRETVAAASAPAPAPAKSIAVLAFSDLSPGHDQEYFSDGMSEEILNALVKLKDLKVAGRTSSFSFKGKNVDLREIGKVLGVANVLEGSVRKQGDKVRITAQLIRTADDTHLFSESYDGDLSDVFALQERIARAIADKLQVALGDSRRPLAPVLTSNTEAYALYLQASAIFSRRDGTRFNDAKVQLEHALQLDPAFARAESRLAALLAAWPNYVKVDPAKWAQNVELHARRASELDPTLAEPYAARGLALVEQRHFIQARPLLDQAFALDPDDPTARFWKAITLIQTGYLAQGYALIDRLLETDPMYGNALWWRGLGHVYAGDTDRAEPLLLRAADSKLAFADVGLSWVSIAHHRQGDAITQLSNGMGLMAPALAHEAAGKLAQGILGSDAQRRDALAVVDRYLQARPEVVDGIILYALVRLGEPGRALTLAQRGPTNNDTTLFGLLWTPFGRPVRTAPEFAEFLRKSELPALWDKYGAPAMCRKLAAGEYDCTIDAAAGS